MKLMDLVGLHKLSGVDRLNENIELCGDEFQDCEVLNFVLDNKTYTAIQDPQDGYRSSMKEIKISNAKVVNIFCPQRVMCIYRVQLGSHECDLLEMYDVHNGKLVLSVGTDNTDDYYPYWVASFYPENMSVNTTR